MFREDKGKGAVGTLSLCCFEMLPVMIAAAQELGASITIQTSLGTAEYINSETLIAAIKALVKKADTNVCLYINHCKSIETLKKVVDLGYSSVMYDNSDLPLEENIRNTQEIAAYAYERNVSVEGEIRSTGGAEDGTVVGKSNTAHTKPADAVRSVKETNVDILVVVIGTTYGQYKSKANINYESLETLQDELPDAGLVPHGGIGANDEDMKRCIKGMRKINVDTELNRSYIEGVNASFPDTIPLTSL